MSSPFLVSRDLCGMVSMVVDIFGRKWEADWAELHDGGRGRGENGAAAGQRHPQRKEGATITERRHERRKRGHSVKTFFFGWVAA